MGTPSTSTCASIASVLPADLSIRLEGEEIFENLFKTLAPVILHWISSSPSQQGERRMTIDIPNKDKLIDSPQWKTFNNSFEEATGHPLQMLRLNDRVLLTNVPPSAWSQADSSSMTWDKFVNHGPTSAKINNIKSPARLPSLIDTGAEITLGDRNWLKVSTARSSEIATGAIGEESMKITYFSAATLVTSSLGDDIIITHHRVGFSESGNLKPLNFIDPESLLLRLGASCNPTSSLGDNPMTITLDFGNITIPCRWENGVYLYHRQPTEAEVSQLPNYHLNTVQLCTRARCVEDNVDYRTSEPKSRSNGRRSINVIHVRNDGLFKDGKALGEEEHSNFVYLKRNFLYSPEEVVRRTQQVTNMGYSVSPQSYEMTARNAPLPGPFDLPRPNYRLKMSHERVCIDIWEPDNKGLDLSHFHNYVLIVYGSRTKLILGYGMSAKSQAVAMFRKYIRDRGIPWRVHSDNEAVLMGPIGRLLDELCVPLTSTEPHHPNQNEAETAVKNSKRKMKKCLEMLNRMEGVQKFIDSNTSDLLKGYTTTMADVTASFNNVLRKTRRNSSKKGQDVEDKLYLRYLTYLFDHILEVMSVLHNKSTGKTPYEMAYGVTPDVSWNMFHWYEPVDFFARNSSFTKPSYKPGRFLGHSPHAGNGLVYYVLNLETKRVVQTSSVRSSFNRTTIEDSIAITSNSRGRRDKYNQNDVQSFNNHYGMDESDTDDSDGSGNEDASNTSNPESSEDEDGPGDNGSATQSNQGQGEMENSVSPDPSLFTEAGMDNSHEEVEESPTTPSIAEERTENQPSTEAQDVMYDPEDNTGKWRGTLTRNDDGTRTFTSPKIPGGKTNFERQGWKVTLSDSDMERIESLPNEEPNSDSGEGDEGAAGASSSDDLEEGLDDIEPNDTDNETLYVPTQVTSSRLHKYKLSKSEKRKATAAKRAGYKTKSPKRELLLTVKWDVSNGGLDGEEENDTDESSFDFIKEQIETDDGDNVHYGNLVATYILRQDWDSNDAHPRKKEAHEWATGWRERYPSSINSIVPQPRPQPKMPETKFGFKVPKTLKDIKRLDEEIASSAVLTSLLKQQKVKSWFAATKKEIDKLILYGCFETEDQKEPVRSGYQKMPCHFVFDVKPDTGGGIILKARFVAGGHRVDSEGIPKYLSTIDLTTVRIALTDARKNGQRVLQGDLSNGYIHAPTVEKVYFTLDEWWGSLSGMRAYCVKALYGLAGSAHAFGEYVKRQMLSIGFHQCEQDPDCWLRRENYGGTDLWTRCLFYVDDFLLTSTQPELVYEEIKNVFEIKFCEEPVLYLGADINDDHGFMTMSAKTYILETLKNLEETLKVTIRKMRRPMNPLAHPEFDSSPLLDEENKRLFQHITGVLNWLVTLCRIDIAFATMSLQRFCSSPREGHLKLAIEAMGWLKSTPTWRLYINENDLTGFPQVDPTVFSEMAKRYVGIEEIHSTRDQVPLGLGGEITIFVDSDYAHDLVTRRSVTGIIVLYCGTPIYWHSKRQTRVGGSTYEVEFMACKTASEVAHVVRRLLRSMGIPVQGHARILGDNLGMIQSATLAASALKKKALGVAYHMCREGVAMKAMLFYKVRSQENIADALTKALSGPVLTGLISRLSPLTPQQLSVDVSQDERSVELTGQSSSMDTGSDAYDIVEDTNCNASVVTRGEDHDPGSPKVAGIYGSSLEDTYESVFSVPRVSTLTRG